LRYSTLNLTPFPMYREKANSNAEFVVKTEHVPRSP
jgi:hypothetical protein